MADALTRHTDYRDLEDADLVCETCIGAFRSCATSRQQNLHVDGVEELS